MQPDGAIPIPRTCSHEYHVKWLLMIPFLSLRPSSEPLPVGLEGLRYLNGSPLSNHCRMSESGTRQAIASHEIALHPVELRSARRALVQGCPGPWNALRRFYGTSRRLARWVRMRRALEWPSSR